MIIEFIFAILHNDECQKNYFMCFLVYIIVIKADL